jgi:hypothetical protein
MDVGRRHANVSHRQPANGGVTGSNWFKALELVKLSEAVIISRLKT